MSAYVVVNVEVTNPEQFKKYQELAGPAVQKYGGKLLGKGAEPHVLEGKWGAPMVVLLEFDSEDKAKEWYDSPEYKEAIAARDGASRFDAVIVPAA